ncbi:hypothetical protein CH330_03705 [candidate division WOR-3 bacterium JGI_Cruoil_03_51_56]|uniref:Uncharacterized protein n=1 Tax=candidate division WOR-3 bacterium JGI_Cruoil_03_51_56 TaxID=1973747 RepID=A0A235BV28_UNCW3|nr:MAG: hypothetical protein CH330_03705 [candidate division WOR-3 bacterium JGI_Cruoil_03_51_56]
MSQHWRLISVALIATVLMTGCMTIGLYETARTAPPGKFQGGGTLTPLHINVTDDGVAGGFYPAAELFAKIGLGPNFDIGARWAFGPGMALNAKAQFLKGPLDGAIYLSGSFYGLVEDNKGFGMYSLSPRLILSSETRSGFPFAINGGIRYIGKIGGGGTLAAVAGAGLPFRLRGTRSVRIIPELSISLPVFSSSTFKHGGTRIYRYSGVEGFYESFGISCGYVGPDRR